VCVAEPFCGNAKVPADEKLDKTRLYALPVCGKT